MANELRALSRARGMWNHLAHDSTVPGSARWALLRGATTVSGRKNTKHDADELHVWLSAQPTVRLVELIWGRAQGDDRFVLAAID